MEDQNKNMIIAIALSLIVLLGWQMFFVAPKEEELRRQQAEQAGTTGEEGTRGSADTAALRRSRSAAFF